MKFRSASDRAGLVLHITNIPTPYRLPMYRAVREGLNHIGLDFVVLFLGKGKRARHWEVPDEEFAGLDCGFVSESSPFPDIVDRVKRARPAVVVLAWGMDPLALRLLWYCRSRRIPCLVYSGETVDALAKRSYPWLRNLVRVPFFAFADGFISYGTKSTEYLKSRGVDGSRISAAINVVDTHFFLEEADRLATDRVREVQTDTVTGFNDPRFCCHLLLVSYPWPGKGVEETLRALAHLDRGDIAMHIVGMDEGDGAIASLVSDLRLEGRVFYHGKRQKKEMPWYYAMADVVLFPSFVDVFGLVMVEGAASGRPVIASCFSGGTVDVIFDGVNGFVVDPSDISAYSEAIRALAEDPQMRERMGAASREIAKSSLMPEHAAAGYVRAIERAISVRPPEVVSKLMRVAS